MGVSSKHFSHLSRKDFFQHYPRQNTPVVENMTINPPFTMAITSLVGHSQ